jgi:hypothetical protein
VEVVPGVGEVRCTTKRDVLKIAKMRRSVIMRLDLKTLKMVCSELNTFSLVLGNNAK